jgi:hypothetical protein
VIQLGKIRAIYGKAAVNNERSQETCLLDLSPRGNYNPEDDGKIHGLI